MFEVIKDDVNAEPKKITGIYERIRESRFIHSPGQIGSVTPSSKYLAPKMIDAVPWNQVHAIAELGAGTGPITNYIQAAVIEGTKVVLFEKDPHLQKKLQHQFPKFTCYTDGCEIQSALKQEDIVQLDCILSATLCQLTTM